MVQRVEIDDDNYEDRYEPADDNAPSGVCSCCGESCQAVLEDVGIGPYEYWGYKGVDVRLEYVSPCCGEEVIDGEDDE